MVRTGSGQSKMVGFCEYGNEHPKVLENWQVIENPRRFLLKKFIIPRS